MDAFCLILGGIIRALICSLVNEQVVQISSVLKEIGVLHC